MYRYEDIKTIHLEVTQNCQAACPMCDRNCNGEGVNPHIKLDELSLQDCKKIFSPAVKIGHNITSSALLKHLVNSDLRSFNLEIL